MKLNKGLMTLAGVSILTACSSFQVPESREHFIELIKDDTGAFSSFHLVYTKEFDKSFDQATKNIDKKIGDCIPGGYTQHATVGSTASHYNKVTNNSRIDIISQDKAEITVQQHHTDTIMQSDGGLYLLAADVYKASNGIKIDFYTGTNYSELAEAIELWAQGSDKCHGVGGND